MIHKVHNTNSINNNYCNSKLHKYYSLIGVRLLTKRNKIEKLCPHMLAHTTIVKTFVILI